MIYFNLNSIIVSFNNGISISISVILAMTDFGLCISVRPTYRNNRLLLEGSFGLFRLMKYDNI